MNKQVGTIIKTKTFKVGDVICHINNFKNGMFFFFKASDEDVKHRNSYYLKINITDNENK